VRLQLQHGSLPSAAQIECCWEASSCSCCCCSLAFLAPRLAHRVNTVAVRVRTGWWPAPGLGRGPTVAISSRVLSAGATYTVCRHDVLAKQMSSLLPAEVFLKMPTHTSQQSIHRRHRGKLLPVHAVHDTTVLGVRNRASQQAHSKTATASVQSSTQWLIKHSCQIGSFVPRPCSPARPQTRIPKALPAVIISTCLGCFFPLDLGHLTSRFHTNTASKYHHQWHSHKMLK
jgi:hypothetical protein